jgi:hypothetical protein
MQDSVLEVFCLVDRRVCIKVFKHHPHAHADKKVIFYNKDFHRLDQVTGRNGSNIFSRAQ